jgi:hypothetical protein
MYENSKKTGGFAHVLAYKSPKTPFFAHKHLTRYAQETFFEEYMNFQNSLLKPLYLFKLSKVIYAPSRTD